MLAEIIKHTKWFGILMRICGCGQLLIVHFFYLENVKKDEQGFEELFVTIFGQAVLNSLLLTMILVFATVGWMRRSDNIRLMVGFFFVASVSTVLWGVIWSNVSLYGQYYNVYSLVLMLVISYVVVIPLVVSVLRYAYQLLKTIRNNS